MFSEPYITHFRRRYFGFIGTMMLTCLLMVPFYSILLAEEDCAVRQQAAFILLVVGTCMLALLVLEILASLETQRFEIYDDKIAIPNPRGFSLLRPNPRTIMRKDVEYAVLDHLEQAGAFQTEIDGEPYYGSKGEWRCIFRLRNRETYVLTSYDVRPRGLVALFLPLRPSDPSYRCVPALRKFVVGLEGQSRSL